MLAKKTAGTGTPIDQLSGGSKFMAQLANIGGGSKKQVVVEYKRALV